MSADAPALGAPDAAEAPAAAPPPASPKSPTLQQYEQGLPAAPPFQPTELHLGAQVMQPREPAVSWQARLDHVADEKARVQAAALEGKAGKEPPLAPSQRACECPRGVLFLVDCPSGKEKRISDGRVWRCQHNAKVSECPACSGRRAPARQIARLPPSPTHPSPLRQRNRQPASPPANPAWVLDETPQKPTSSPVFASPEKEPADPYASAKPYGSDLKSALSSTGPSMLETQIGNAMGSAKAQARWKLAGLKARHRPALAAC